MEHMNDTMEQSQKTDYLLLEYAEGTIGAREDQQEKLDDVTELLAQGEFHTLVDGYGLIKCIDGRAGGYGVYPNSAGGTETLLVADDLTTKHFGGDSGTTAEAYQSLLEHLEGNGETVGGHSDNHSTSEASGCGANDKLDKIYGFIARSGHLLRDLSDKLGVPVEESVHQMILANASARSEFSSGAELLQILKQGENVHHEELQDAHNEVVAVINTQPDTSLDREALAEQFGENYQAFNVDVWAFSDAAGSISDMPDEIPAKVAAMVYYNLATAHVLCGKNLRVVVL